MHCDKLSFRDYDTCHSLAATSAFGEIDGDGHLNDLVAARWADLLVDYCLRVERGETIVLSSSVLAQPLVEACFKAIVRAGRASALAARDPRASRVLPREGQRCPAFAHLPPEALFEAQKVAARIRIAAENDIHSMSRIDPRRQAAYDRARDPIRQAARHGRWVLTQYPTEAYAQAAGMSLPEYEDFVTRAMFLDRDDPQAAWQELGRRQAGLVEFMTGAKTVRIEAPGTDLTLSVAGRTWINSDGKRNMPSGEIFTGPLEDSAQGRLELRLSSLPRRPRDRRNQPRDRRTARWSRPERPAAKTTCKPCSISTRAPAAWASWGWASTAASIGSPAASSTTRRSVEPCTSPWARATPRPEARNQSALHWDLIVDTRTDGRITADGRVVMQNGQWLVG